MEKLCTMRTMSQLSLIGSHKIENLENLSLLTECMAKEMRAGDVALLSGELGAGKTTFTQFLGKAFGVQDAITSPTYTLVGEYNIPNNIDISILVHVDLYRTEGKNNNYVQEIIEQAKQNKAVVVIEWAEYLERKPKGNYWNITITSEDITKTRIVTIV